VEDYHRFVPWCCRSHVLRKAQDGTYLEAELEVGFQMLNER
jgi:ribosome-associated toxin RatA of RatAB toxin-antitoxin module